MNSKPRSKRSKAQTKDRNWKQYNANLKRRGHVLVWFEPEVLRNWFHNGPCVGRGRPYTYSDFAIEVCLTIRQVYSLGFRQTEGMAESLVSLLGKSLPIPVYSTFSRRQKNLNIQMNRKKRRSKILLILVDSTGLKVYGEGEWKVRQHGWGKHRTWQKMHVIIDAETQEALGVELTTNAVHDAEMVVPLLEQIEQRVKKFSGDGAYDKWLVYDALKERGINPVIPPQKNAKIKRHGNACGSPLPRDENLRKIRRWGRKGWKKKSGYHQRSKVETYMYRFKTAFGDRLKARLTENQITEVRIGAKILNRFLNTNPKK